MSLTSFNRRYDGEAIEMMISKLCLLGIMMLGVRCCFYFILFFYNYYFKSIILTERLELLYFLFVPG